MVYLNLTVERVVYNDKGETKMVIPKIMENHFLGTVVDCSTNAVCQDCDRRTPRCLSCPTNKYLVTDGTCASTCASNIYQTLDYISLDDTTATLTTKVASV